VKATQQGAWSWLEHTRSDRMNCVVISRSQDENGVCWLQLVPERFDRGTCTTFRIPVDPYRFEAARVGSHVTITVDWVSTP
jgi:hypothetical protein